ncbi:L-aspartate oxidase [Leptolyngbya sp. FACHB-261]|nr:L-aspartate oxidase [Leptolyngbya sp. FACHB-261]
MRYASEDALLKPDFDVLVIGGGAAGLYTSLLLPQACRVGLVTKDTLSLSASGWAQGGIAAVIDPGDSTALHIADTMAAGVGLCDPVAVKFLVEQAPRHIAKLVEMGVAFDRYGEQLALTLEAAHSRRRVLHAADATGRELVSTLTAQVLARSNIQILNQTLVLDLWQHEGRCQGVCLVESQHLPLKPRWLSARAVILATGGGGQLYARTTNPPPSTGDGVAMAWRVGALLQDLEFMQFHPTALSVPGAPRFLISEAVRGEGAHLLDAAGERFAFAYHPLGELAPRDVVSRAIFTHLQQTQPNNSNATVFLDLRSIPRTTVEHRFPNILRVCQQWGVDPLTQAIPVTPAAHYWMGGIVTNLQGATTVPGLYAIGETASTGVHGANRLASNSLLECLVFGAEVAEAVITEPTPTHLTPPQSLELTPTDGPSPVAEIRQELPYLLWRTAGLSRNGADLSQGLDQVEAWQAAASPFFSSSQGLPKAPELRTALETHNLLDVSYLLLKSALYRTESRGAHFRQDYPDSQVSWQVHTLVQGQVWQQGKLGVDLPV